MESIIFINGLSKKRTCTSSEIARELFIVKHPIKGYSDRLSAACVTVAATCLNSIACFHFARRNPSQEKDPNIFVLKDFQTQEAKAYFFPCALDPRRRQIFTSTIAHSLEQLELKHCISEERKCYADTARGAAYV